MGEAAGTKAGAGASTGTCHVCGGGFAAADLRPFDLVRPSLAREVEAMRPGWAEGAAICPADLAEARARAVERLIASERGPLGPLDREVVESIASGELVSRGPDEEPATLGDRMADRLAAWGGSWAFLIGFGAVIGAWAAVNTVGLLRRPFDPYPFVFLNLVLSMLAAIQAPVIMMSQRRQEQKDRERAENDYMVNLKAELEIRQLHDKIDGALTRQWRAMAELQRLQIELLEEAARDRRGGA